MSLCTRHSLMGWDLDDRLHFAGGMKAGLPPAGAGSRSWAGLGGGCQDSRAL